MFIMSAGSRRRLLVDRGASQHMICVSAISREVFDTRRPLDQAILSQSAKEIIWVEACVDIWIHELAVRITAVLAPFGNDICVLSIAKLVDETGYDYIWGSVKIPHLVKDNVYAYCYTHRGCPFICNVIEDDQHPAASEATRADVITAGAGDCGGEASLSPVIPSVRPERKSHEPKPKQESTSQLTETKKPIAVDDPFAHDVHYETSHELPDMAPPYPTTTEEIEVIAKDRSKKQSGKK